MIAQLVLTFLLGGLLLYAAKEARKSPTVGAMTVLAAMAGLYVVWVPRHASALAEWAGIGRGADLILYVWAALSLIIMLNLHLKLRGQLELITALARSVALASARHGQPTTANRLDKPSTSAGSSQILERAAPPPGHRPKRPRSAVQRRVHSR
jgi:hypothetical protein